MLMNEPFHLSDRARSQSDWAMVYGLDADYLHFFTPERALQFQFHGTYTDYSYVDWFDTTDLSASLGPTFQTGHWIVSFPAVGTYLKYGSEDGDFSNYYTVSMGFSPQVRYKLSSSWELGASLAYFYKKYYQDGRYSHLCIVSPHVRFYPDVVSYAQLDGYVMTEDQNWNIYSYDSVGVQAVYFRSFLRILTFPAPGQSARPSIVDNERCMEQHNSIRLL